MHSARQGAVTPSRIDVTWNGDKDGNNRRLKVRREVKRAFIELAQFARRHAQAFRTQQYRVAARAQHALRILKTPRALVRASLSRREENSDEIADHRHRWKLS